MRKHGFVLFIIVIIVIWISTTPPSIFAEEQTAWEIAEVYGAARAVSLSSGWTAGLPPPGAEEYSFRPMATSSSDSAPLGLYSP